MSNPLLKEYRKPSAYVALPSDGKWYSEKMRLSVDNELAVYPMTARDELIMKTPDALFNGEATRALLASCTPDIPNPDEVPACDLPVIVVAIRQASYGDEIDFDVTCPSCKHVNMVQIMASGLLANAKKNTEDPVIKISGDFRVKVRPYNVKDRTLLAIEQVKQQRMLQDIVKQSEKDDEKNAENFGKTFVEVADLTVKLIAGAIESVATPEGEEIDNRENILEWLQNITKKDYDLITAKMEKLSDSGITNEHEAKCQECSHEWKTKVDIDAANFFGG